MEFTSLRVLMVSERRVEELSGLGSAGSVVHVDAAVGAAASMTEFPWLQAGAEGPVAAIDCGTNSIRLLVGSAPQGDWVDHVRLMRIVRLGQGVDRTGRLDTEAIDRTVAAAAEYAQICREARVCRLRFVATSASRDASNREIFTSRIERVLGVSPQVVSGEEEAALSFRGATAHLSSLVGPVLLIDIGGGSTEFVFSVDGGEFQAVSTPLGSVRIHEKFPAFAMGSPSAAVDEDVEALRWIEGLLDGVAQVVPFERVRTLVAVAGTVTTVAALELGLDCYDVDRLHGYRSSYERLQRTCEQMMSLGVEQRAALGFMPSGREDVIGAGAAVFRAILNRLQDCGEGTGEVVISEYDILDGIALSLLPG